jgi:hypothetical protein
MLSLTSLQKITPENLMEQLSNMITAIAYANND